MFCQLGLGSALKNVKLIGVVPAASVLPCSLSLPPLVPTHPTSKLMVSVNAMHPFGVLLMFRI
ncbi:hypothetical protein KNP414_04416 [Paenibacillus mucilaginosus KNP414]|uniref:Uncharacterized protein n=1 Tax=Paenibacillus mucilaginosus (strain KNP414) TaxID=1036673 RepID=F8F6J4_PAEMK|nr:hypothetical protein KNP414_04416 [Paenibacillus mucilaginosus KNP414]